MLEHIIGSRSWIGVVLVAAGVLLASASPTPAGVVDANATSFDRAVARMASAPMIPRTLGALNATAARFGSVLVLEEECGGSPLYMQQALDNLVQLGLALDGFRPPLRVQQRVLELAAHVPAMFEQFGLGGPRRHAPDVIAGLQHRARLGPLQQPQQPPAAVGVRGPQPGRRRCDAGR